MLLLPPLVVIAIMLPQASSASVLNSSISAMVSSYMLLMS